MIKITHQFFVLFYYYSFETRTWKKTVVLGGQQECVPYIKMGLDAFHVYLGVYILCKPGYFSIGCIWDCCLVNTWKYFLLQFQQKNTWSTHLFSMKYSPNYTVPFRYNVFRCHSSLMTDQPLDPPGIKAAVVALTRSVFVWFHVWMPQNFPSIDLYKIVLT